MGITTSSGSATKGGSRGRPLCWDCGLSNAVMTVHPGYGYSLCPTCCARIGLDVVLMESVEDEGDQKVVHETMKKVMEGISDLEGPRPGSVPPVGVEISGSKA